MGVVEAMVVGGAALQIYGNYQANHAQARANRANAAFYREQAKLTLEAAKREQAIFEKESDQFFGSQVNAFAKGGVDLSGSALLYLAGTKQEMSNESVVILENGIRAANNTLLQADSLEKEAKRLTSFENQFIGAAVPALNAGGTIAGRTTPSASKTTVGPGGAGG